MLLFVVRFVHSFLLLSCFTLTICHARYTFSLLKLLNKLRIMAFPSSEDSWFTTPYFQHAYICSYIYGSF